jgi:hypothetical protein
MGTVPVTIEPAVGLVRTPVGAVPSIVTVVALEGVLLLPAVSRVMALTL